jgi:hypothetical protein
VNRLKIIIFAGLGLLDVGAGAFALNAWTREPDDAPVARRAAHSLAPAAKPEPPAPVEGPDVETLARPLFMKSRRPSKGGPKDGPGAAQPPTGMKLHAVVALEDSLRVYLVADGSAKGKWLRVGDELNAWIVESISRRNVALRHDDQTVSIGFGAPEVQHSPASTPPAPPPQSPAESAPQANSAPPQPDEPPRLARRDR